MSEIIKKRKEQEKEGKRLLKEIEKKEKENKKKLKAEEKEKKRFEKEKFKREKDEEKINKEKTKKLNKEEKEVIKLEKFCLKKGREPFPQEYLIEEEVFTYSKEQQEKFKSLRNEDGEIKLYPVKIIEWFPFNDFSAKKLLNVIPDENMITKKGLRSFNSYSPNSSLKISPFIVFELSDFCYPKEIKIYENFYNNTVKYIEFSEDGTIWGNAIQLNIYKNLEKGGNIETVRIIDKKLTKYVRITFLNTNQTFEIHAIEIIATPLLKEHKIELNRGIMKSFCDSCILIETNDKIVRVEGHKMVFSKSGIWKRIFKRQNSIKLQIDVEIFKVIYHYLYFGELQLNEENHEDVIEYLKKFEILVPIEYFTTDLYLKKSLKSQK